MALGEVLMRHDCGRSRVSRCSIAYEGLDG